MKNKPFIIEFLLLFFLAMAIVIPVKAFVFQPFFIKFSSMEPNYHEGDYLIVDELSYRFREPVRGEVIVFRYPLNQKELFIKRIVGLPGETIVIKDGKVYLSQDNQEKLLEEPYLPDNTYTPGKVFITLKSDEYFVLGDNRAHSSDSRMWGPIKRKDIVGRVLFRPFSLIQLRNLINSFQSLISK